MIRNFIKLTPSKVKGCLKSYNKHYVKYAKPVVAASAEAASADAEPKWQLVAAACVTRTPIISPELKPIEREFKEFAETREVELSLKSNHEIRLMEDKVRQDLLNLAERDHVDMEEAAKETGLEFEDTSLEELKAYEFGPRITEEDNSKNLCSLNRALDRCLVLTINQKFGSDYQWVFPQTPWNPGETLRQSCERLMKDICGPKLKVKILGNSPCGFFKYKYPKEVRKQGFIGAKVFFFSGHVLAFDSDGLETNEKFSDYLWLTHEELKTKLGKSYFQAVSKFLVSDQ